MMRHEFEERIGGEVRQSDYEIIEHVYTWHPAISNTEGKEQIATLYKVGGMRLIKDMEPTAKLMEELDAEKRDAERRLKGIQKKIEDVVCGRTEMGNKGMAINFQVMTENQKNKYGKYVPDWEALKAGASCEEEKEYIDKIIAQNERWESKGCGKLVGFAYNMVYITKQSCGHYEIFQFPHNEHYTLEKILEEAQEHTKSKCSRCICGR